MVTHSSVLAWRMPMDRGAWRAPVHAQSTLFSSLGRLLGSRNQAWGDSSAVAQVPKSRLGVRKWKEQGHLLQLLSTGSGSEIVLGGAVGMGGPRGPVP